MNMKCYNTLSVAAYSAKHIRVWCTVKTVQQLSGHMLKYSYMPYRRCQLIMM